MSQVLTERPQGSVAKAGASKAGIADCDIHPCLARPADILPYLAPRWRGHMERYGMLPRHGFQSGPAYPKGAPDAARGDSWPPGGRPGSDLGFMQRQHLDPNNVVLGVLNVISPAAGAAQNVEFGAELCRALNEWQVAEWTGRDGRLKGSVVVPYEDGEAAAAEIAHWAGHGDFVQVLLMSRTAEPLGQRRYWPIYLAAERAGLPVGVHAFGYGGYPVTAGGWPSYYIEEMVGHAQGCQAQLTSLVLEGVFERFPGLRMVMIEAGFAWLPSLAWRLDKHWARLRDETPHLARPPSEVLRRHVWLTTQPMEEPDRRRNLSDVIGWIGLDRLLFATDYPHWDYDDPAWSLPVRVEDSERERLFLRNAMGVYGVG